MKHDWTEATMAAALANCDSIGNSLLVVPNCSWTGWEADLLIIERNLRIVDVEIKISRSDLKADASKDKWWKKRPWSRNRRSLNEQRVWPEKVWKHYYVVPAEIWHQDLLGSLPSASGVLAITRDARWRNGASIRVIRRAKPNRAAKPISPGDCIDIARLASLRMWAALRKQLNTTNDRAGTGPVHE